MAERRTEITNRAESDDGTRALLHTGIWMLAAGAAAALLAATVFGGISRQGPHTNAGWLALMAALMSLPFGLMLFTLGAAKWLRNRRLARRSLAPDGHGSASR